MDKSTEIRKLTPSNVREVVQILEQNESWKRLMGIIPKVLNKEDYQCDVTLHNMHKYNSEHFRLIENASRTMRKTCTEILFDEWGTSGRVRPAIGHLLYLLTKAELFRAADYVAVKLLHQEPPARPADGPAAPVTTALPEMSCAYLQEVERILDEIDYPSSVIANLTNNSYDVNINQSSINNNSVPVIPKIVVSEISDVSNSSGIAVPLVTENRRKRMNRQNASLADASGDSDNNTVSDMIKFSQSEISDSSDTNNVSLVDSNVVPNISTLMSSESNVCSETPGLENLPGDWNSDSLPVLSALNMNSDITVPETQQNVPAISELLSGNLPLLSNLLESNVELSNNCSDPSASHENSSSPHLPSVDTNECMPNLSILNAGQQSQFLPQMSLLNASPSSDVLESKKPNVVINVIEYEESGSVPHFSALLCDKKFEDSSKHFLPISDHASDIPSEASSFASSKNSNASTDISHNSNLSQHSDLSRSSRPTCVSPLPNLYLNTELPHFTYFQIETATNNFDETPHKNCRQVENPLVKTNGRFLGSGAFGSVFLALELAEKPVAVKKLFLNNVDVVNVDDTVTKQFKNEVEVLSKYKHENLLSLVGYSCDGPTYCLLYEFIPGGALKDRLQNAEEKLIWTDRLYIALGTARAVSYLHTAYSTPLIHRDIKTANILLDCTNKPKLCDFGLIKLIPNQHTNTSTTAFGTSAYMAREAFRGDVSVKLDTFSFGVVLLELITGLPPLDENREGYDIVTHVEEVCEDSDIFPLIDTKAGSWVAKDINFAEELYKISVRCLEENKRKRPTMVEVTDKLAELIKESA